MAGTEPTVGGGGSEDGGRCKKWTGNYTRKACFKFIPFGQRKKERKKGRGSWFVANQPEAAAATGTMGAHNWRESRIRDYRC